MKTVDEERTRRQNQMKGRVQAELKSKFGKSAAAQIKETTKSNIDDMRKKDRDHKDDMKKMKDKIGGNRAMLYD